MSLISFCAYCQYKSAFFMITDLFANFYIIMEKKTEIETDRDTDKFATA